MMHTVLLDFCNLTSIIWAAAVKHNTWEDESLQEVIQHISIIQTQVSKVNNMDNDDAKNNRNCPFWKPK